MQLLDRTAAPLPLAASTRPPGQLLFQAQHGDAAVASHPEVGGNDARLIVDAPTFRERLMRDIEGARSVINAQEFIWTDDGSGRQVADLLKRKAREGVEVNVQVDGTGSSGFPFGLHPALARPAYRAFLADLRAAGVHVQENWRYGGKLAAGATPTWDHRKLFTVDGTVAYLGGMNLSGRFDDWHDAMARLTGPVAAQVGAEFLGRWVDLGGTVSARNAAALAAGEADPGLPGAAQARVITNSPGAVRELTDSYLDDVRHATKRLWVTSPSVANRALVDALVVAAKRGVDVRVVAPTYAARDSMAVLRTITGTYLDELAAAGVKVYEHPRTVHAKVLLSDDAATVSSFNLNSRSSSMDLEAGVRVRDLGFTRDVEAMMERDFAEATQVPPERGRGPVRQALRGVRELFGLTF